MKYFLLLVLLVDGTFISAQQLSEAPSPQLLRAAAEPANVPELQLFGVIPELSRASKLSPLLVTGSPADMPGPPAYKPTQQLAKSPEIPQFHKKIFIAEVAAYTVPNILDGITTVRGVRRGFTEAPYPKGAAELLGSRPGVARYTLVMGAMQTATTFAAYRLQHSRSRMLRMFGHGLMAEGIYGHTSGFVNNLRLGPHP